MMDKEPRSFRSLLLERLRILEHQYKSAGMPGFEDGNLDRTDMATVEYEKGLFFHFHEREYHEIDEICEALRRIEEGSFCTCEDCKGRIDYRRLMANPLARLCIQCQRVRERE